MQDVQLNLEQQEILALLFGAYEYNHIGLPKEKYLEAIKKMHKRIKEQFCFDVQNYQFEVSNKILEVLFKKMEGKKK
jgi:hypothetical protein